MVFNIDTFLLCVCCGTMFLGLFLFIFSCSFQGIKRLALLLSMGLMAVLGGFIYYKITETIAAIIIYAVGFFGILSVFGGLFLIFRNVTSGNDEAKTQTVLVCVFYALCMGLMVFSVSFGLNNM